MTKSSFLVADSLLHQNRQLLVAANSYSNLVNFIQKCSNLVATYGGSISFIYNKQVFLTSIKN